LGARDQGLASERSQMLEARWQKLEVQERIERSRDQVVPGASVHAVSR
jgi:hypothetical protein